MSHATRLPFVCAALLLIACPGQRQVRADTGAAAAAAPAAAGLLFYAPFDEHGRGVLLPQRTGVESPIEFRRADGVVGSAASCPAGAGVTFPLTPFVSNTEGSLAAWLKIDWDPKQTASRRLVDLGRFASLYRYEGQPYLTYALYYHHLDEKHDYGCTFPMEGWRAGQWHHVAITWSWSGHRRALYLDGRKVREATIQRIPNQVTVFRIGPDVEAADELCVYSKAVDDREIERLFQAGRAGRAAFDLGPIPPARLAAASLPQGQAPTPPKFVNWSFDGAEQRDNGLRGEVTLHGWWRWQRGRTAFEPPEAGRWLYRKAPAQSSWVEAFPVRDEQFRRVPAADPRVGAALLNGVAQWSQREFAPPAAWKGRRLELRIDSLVDEGAVYLNGQLLGTLPRFNLGGTFDVTDRIRWDRANSLTLFSDGADGDVTLASTPAGAAVEGAWLETSWRKRSVAAHLRVRAPAAGEFAIAVDILPAGGGEPVKRLQARRTLAAGANAVDLSAEWPDAVPWSLSDPHLYEYRVTVAAADGRKLDETFPARFGFREIWIDGGDFMLNGRPIHLFGHSNSHLTSAAELGDGAYIRYSLSQWKLAGMNCVTPWQGEERNPTLHPLLDAADELGIAILPNMNLPTGEDAAPTETMRAQWDTLYRTFIERYRQHPSLLCWMVGSGAHNFDFCPAVLDGRFTPQVPRIGPLRETWRRAAEIDPTRPIFGLSDGNAGSVWTSMAYLGFGVDLQSRENWPLRWSRTRAKPLMPCEFSLPCHPDWYARTRGRSARAQYHPAHSQSLATEYAAMYLGPDVYLSESDAYVRSLRSPPGRPEQSNGFFPTKGLFAETLRAWRAYGMSFIYHAEVPFFFTGRQPTFPAAPDRDPRRCSATPEHLNGSLQAADELSAYGRRVAEATAPLMAFLGGPDGRFTLKDHCCWAGERIRKCLVVVNDTDQAVRLAADWTLQDGQGRAAAAGRIETEVAPGRQETSDATIELAAPDAKQRTEYTLRVAARTASGLAVPVAPLTLTVFPADIAVAMQNPVVLFDPAGRTGKALAALGIAAGPMPEQLTGRHRLIVGSRGFDKPASRQALRQAGFDAAVADGMRVLVFEQAAADWDGPMMGLRLKRLATRRAFVRCPGHPVLAGLAESDVQFLRGDSDLIEPWPDPGPMPAEYPVHFWHWGNDNIVATFAVEKPQVGAARAILDCGFDLEEAALLEVARGRGCMIFCQVDLTNRVGRDPVSTRLMRNLLAYLADGQPPPAAPAELAALADRHAPRESVEAWVSRTPAVGGLHAGETFWRQSLRLPAFDARSQTPFFTQVQLGGRSFWLTSLSPAVVSTEWQRAKVARIQAALDFANGRSAADGPTVGEFDDVDRLYPYRWNRLPELGDFDPYVYWRW